MAMVYVLGTGVLNWNRSERLVDRYGYVKLFDACHGDGDAIRLTFPDDVEGKRGRLVAVVLETRESYRVGDLFRGISPETPNVGESIVLGEGTFDVDVEQDPYGYCVGLEPADGRPTDWLDPRKLYRAYDQTVRLELEVVEAEATP